MRGAANKADNVDKLIEDINKYSPRDEIAKVRKEERDEVLIRQELEEVPKSFGKIQEPLAQTENSVKLPDFNQPKSPAESNGRSQGSSSGLAMKMPQDDYPGSNHGLSNSDMFSLDAKKSHGKKSDTKKKVTI